MTVVVDASVIVATFAQIGADGRWSGSEIAGQALAAPHHMLVEAANILRRAELSRELSPDAANLAYADLTALTVQLFPFEPYARRVWELRANLTPYDAWYVAIAEDLDADLVTLDRRLARSSGPRCSFRVPPARVQEPPGA